MDKDEDTSEFKGGFRQKYTMMKERDRQWKEIVVKAEKTDKEISTFNFVNLLGVKRRQCFPTPTCQKAKKQKWPVSHIYVQGLWSVG